MKLFYLVILLNSFSMLVLGQTADTTSVKKDITSFPTPNPFVINEKNYELINTSFITGNSHVVIRSQDNPSILVDGVPINTFFINNTHYPEFLGSMNLLSFDIKDANVNTLQSNGRIISGKYNNAVSFSTHDIKLGKSSPQFELNNFTTLAYQDIDTSGFSTIINFNMQQSFKKFGYRVSLTNGFQDDYIPENGLQRISGNLKFKYEPIQQVSLTGFLDYSDFQDFKRSGQNNFASNRLFTYLNSDIHLTKWMSLHGRYSLNDVINNSDRFLMYNGVYYDGKTYFESSLRKLEYEYKSTHYNIGLNINKAIMNKVLINFELGYNQNDVDYNQYFKIVDQNSYSSNKYVSEGIKDPKTSENSIYSLLKLSNKFLSVQYLFNKTNSTFGKFDYRFNQNKPRANHLVSVKYDIINNSDKLINSLGLQVDYGKLMNYSLIAYNENWVLNYDNDNIQLNTYSSLLNNRVDLNFSLYRKNYKEFMQNFLAWNGLRFSENIGNVIKNGYSLSGNFHILKGSTLNWSTEVSYSRNDFQFKENEESQILLFDTITNNTIISFTNKVSYKKFHLAFELEGKQGLDVNLYENKISVAGPLSTMETFQFAGVTNEGFPISERVENQYRYLTDTDYFILKNLALDYQFSDSKNNKYLIGLQYNKMRRLYLYVNDIEEYGGGFQRPSFFSSISLSFKMKF